MELVPQLTIEEKRQAVYSSLYRYASEAIPLRERAIRRVVLGALLGSSKDEPFPISRILQNLCFGSINHRIRDKIIQEALDQLIQEGKVKPELLYERYAYYLTSEGETDISTLTVSSTQLFQEVGMRLFSDTTEFLPFDVTLHIFRKFAFECFARFGLQIAKTVTGTITHDELVRRIDTRVAFKAAAKDFTILPEQRESLEVRCYQFLTSSDPSCERLKFYLTQGYYFTQLIGLEHTKFNPLAEQVFSGSVFYLDTNVLLTGLLYIYEDISQFIEMIRLAQRLGIELRVSRATINEAQRVILDRMSQIEKIVNVLPNELAERTSDQILKTFYQARDAKPDLTPEEFFQPIDKLEAKLQNEWHIVIDKREALEMIAGRDVGHIEIIMNDEAEKTRGRRKSPLVLQHDVAHYLVIMDERFSNPKTWFLTRDRSLEVVAERLHPDKLSFSFSHIGFLHSISPFVTTLNEETSLADVMSAFISDQIRPIETLFDISELSLMAEFHEDVMATPVDQLIRAFDYVKSRTLRGESYREEDIPRVSLELKKFLTADRDQQLQALQEERRRLAEETRVQTELRIAAEKRADEAIQRGGELEEEFVTLRHTLSETQSTMDEMKKRLIAQEEKSAAERQRTRFIVAVIGVVLGLALLIRSSNIEVIIVTMIPILVNWPEELKLFLGILSSLLFVIPALVYIRNTGWASEVQTIIITIISIFALAVTKVLSKDILSEWSDLIGVGSFIALVVSIALLTKKK